MNTIETFTNETLGTVRAMQKDGVEWFVAKDVCDILEIGNSRMALIRLDDDEKMTVSLTDTHSGKRGGAQELSVVNEYGLWQLVLGSRKPQAKEFKRWLTHEVIPSIRKNGGYIEGQEHLSAEEKEKLEAEVRKLRSKVNKLNEKNKNLNGKVKNLVKIIEHDYSGDFDKKKREVPQPDVSVYDVYAEDHDDFQEDTALFNVSEYFLFEEVKAIINAAESVHIDKSAAKHLVGEMDRLFAERSAV